MAERSDNGGWMMRSTPAQGDVRAERAIPREGGNDEFERRVPATQTTSEGSGEHGARDATMTDRASRQFWYQAANGAEAAGMVNAARHMRHYLGNTGETLSVDVRVAMRDDPR